MHPLMVKIFGWYYMGIVHRVDPPIVITFDALHLQLSHGTSCWSSNIRTKNVSKKYVLFAMLGLALIFRRS